MPGIILNTVLSIRAHCYLCFNFAIIIVCNRHPMRKTQLAQICRLCGWFPWALAGFAHVSAVGWKGSCRLVLLVFAKPSHVSVSLAGTNGLTWLYSTRSLFPNSPN